MSIKNSEQLSFGQIAAHWAREPESYPFEARLARPLAETANELAEGKVLEALVASIWRGEFERSGGSVLTFPESKGTSNLGDQRVDTSVIGHRPQKLAPNPWKPWMEIIRPEILGPTIVLPPIDFDRNDLREGLQQSDWCDPDIVPTKFDWDNPDIAAAKFEALAKSGIDFYPPSFRKTCLEKIAISKDAFRGWCQMQDFALPRFWFGDQSVRQEEKIPGPSRTPAVALKDEAIRSDIPSDKAEDPGKDSREGRREKRTRETKEKHQRWFEIAQEIKNEAKWTRPTDIAKAVAKREIQRAKENRESLKGLNGANIRRRLDEKHPGWSG